MCYLLLIIAIIAICIVTLVVFFKYVKLNSIQKLGALLLVALFGLVAIHVVADRYLYFHGESMYDYRILPYNTRPWVFDRSAGVGFAHNGVEQNGYDLETPSYSYSNRVMRSKYIQVIDTNSDTITLDFCTVVKYGYNKIDLIILVETQDEQRYWLHPYPIEQHIEKDGVTHTKVTYLHSLINEKKIQTDAYHWVTLGEPAFIYEVMLLLWYGAFLIPFLIGGLLVLIPIGLITRKHQYTALKNTTDIGNIVIPIVIWNTPLVISLSIYLPFKSGLGWTWAVLLAFLLLFYVCVFFYLKIWDKCLQYIHSVLQEKNKKRIRSLLPFVHIGLWLTSTFIYYLSILFFIVFVGISTAPDTTTIKGADDWMAAIGIVPYIFLEICLHWQIYRYKRETEATDDKLRAVDY